MRGEADFQASIAAGACQHAEQQDGVAAGAETGARNEERNAAQARDRAYQAERDQRAAEARAAAMDAMVAASRGSGHETEARNVAAQAHADADVAKGVAGAARGAANTATGAAAGARAAATEATRAAAQQAAAAAARANAAANKAEAAAAQRSNSAADATASESQAAEAARSAVQLAEQAASDAVQSLRSAERTHEESDAASAEAVSAATQAKLAVEASLAARASSQAITDPANTAIRVAVPFSGTVAVTVDTDGSRGSATGTIQVTAGHPFWVESRRLWLEARYLRAGDQVRDVGGESLQVTAVAARTEYRKVFNLTVDAVHTFYVAAANRDVLVHNLACLVALKDFVNSHMQFGNGQFFLDKRAMDHFLTRHHKTYWDGSVKPKQTFFREGMTVADVENAVKSVLQQNRDKLVRQGTNGMYQIEGTVDGVTYTLGLNNGRVGQFYPNS